MFAIAGSVPRIQWLISPHRWLYTFAIFNEQGYIVFEGEAYPPEVFSGIGKIGDKTVRCIDAENQVLFHLGYEHDENDMHDVKLLCERFNIPVPSEYK